MNARDCWTTVVVRNAAEGDHVSDCIQAGGVATHGRGRQEKHGRLAVKESFVSVALAATLGMLALAGCSGGTTDSAANTTDATATLQSIDVTSASASVAQGLSVQFAATGTYSDNGTRNITSAVTWSSSNTDVAGIDASGLATAMAPGAVTISATYAGVTGDNVLTVTDPILVSLAVTPATASIVQGATQQFTATGTLSDHSTPDLTTQAAWSSSDASRATIADTGLASSGPNTGSATITASYGGRSGAAQLAVTPAPVAPTITAHPQPVTVTAGQTATFTVTASGTTPLAYQWRRDGANVGTNSTSYTTAATTVSDNGARFSVMVSNSAGQATSNDAVLTVNAATTVRIAYLHHSTGGNVWAGGVPQFFTAYNTAHGTDYRITEITYPDTGGGYPWANYPYDYWNLWVSHTGTSQDRGELNLDQIAASYDVIMFKHCFPVSAIGPDSDSYPPSVSSSVQTIANYQLQYAALKTRMLQFPTKKFIVWTGAALTQASTNQADAQRAQTFFTWVKETWDTPGDNLFVWDFYALETEGTLYMRNAYAASAGDSHPNSMFSTTVAPYIAQRIVDVIEGRGDTGSITGH
jgi:Bacterial Ig-like domain (group 2)/Immunoglobulin domain